MVRWHRLHPLLCYEGMVKLVLLSVTNTAPNNIIAIRLRTFASLLLTKMQRLDYCPRCRQTPFEFSSKWIGLE